MDVAVELARVLTDELVAFAELGVVSVAWEGVLQGRFTWTAGSGPQIMALMDSMVGLGGLEIWVL